MISIAETFVRCRSRNKKVLIPFLTAGYPDEKTFLLLVEKFIASGSDLIEIGIPFSDPLADGKSIQFSSQKALESGFNLDTTLQLLGRLKNGRSVPLIVMSYFNPIRAYGESRFAKRAQQVGVRGLIVPDLTPEEGKPMEQVCRRGNIDLIYLLAPTSGPERRKMIFNRSRGFVYLVSVTGVTGSRIRFPRRLNSWIRRTKRESSLPVCVGFGISSIAQARQISRAADGIIVGSAIVDIIRNSAGQRRTVAAAGSFIEQLRKGINDA